MMNDRFSAQVRQHLLETANELPAHGQLAAVLDRVADTPQRHPLAARLAWFPGRIGPFPSTALRWALIAAALLAATMAVAIFGGGSAPSASTVFEGTWTSTDSLDESRQTLVVAAGVTPAVHFEDDFATGGACVDDPIKVFTADGFGQVTGSRLAVVYPAGGGCGLMTVPIGTWFLDYDEANDTLVDSDRLTWFRIQEGSTLPTQSPATEPPATEPPATQPPATFPAFAVTQPYSCDLEAGTYGGSFGIVQVTATTPTTWHGLEDDFHLEDDGCGLGGAVQLEITVVSQVYADACHWEGTGVDAGTPDALTAAFSDRAVFDTVGPTDVTLGGHAARRYDFSLPAGFDEITCSNGVIQLWRDAARDEGFGPTMILIDSVTVYFVEVDGLTLGVYAGHSRELATPAMLAELDAVVASLRIEP
jgi:hypothetical protein